MTCGAFGGGIETFLRFSLQSLRPRGMLSPLVEMLSPVVAGITQKGVEVFRRKIPVIFAGLVMCTAVVCAAEKEFWEAKPHTEWNEDEVAKLLKDSPWSKSFDVVLGLAGSEQTGFGSSRGGGGGIPRSDSGDFGDTGGMGGTGGGGGGGRGNRGGSMSGSSVRSVRVIVTWYSRPVRLAMARSLTLRNPDPPKQALDSFLNYPDAPYYNIMVIGWVGGFQRDDEAALERLKKDTFLVKKNKERISLADLILPSGRGKHLVLLFPKESGGKPTLTLEDKEVMLQTKVGDNSIRVKFKLADMVVNGEPAL